ncbi:GNAT family N-acetyltransferase [Rhodobacter calidifons]|uniref:GNAT family N-acetyltransferase n=1 Tax=Rhodobacter calidifons TaxID=2715277 RepID=A0ABX0G645_9RHOB|nr:GNAT family N-acetyltransferase [Rhodobacter calidifons]NHB76362.1 GNAT family N-acetyltransferase [Rhodobacter calidifons]
MTPDRLAEVLEATWPPLRRWQVGPFTLRDGAGGGKRVSAASCEGPFTEADLTAAEAAMAQPLMLVRAGDATLDAALDARGWRLVDPVVAYAAPVAGLTAVLPPLAAFPHWPPLEIACAIWAEGGIGPARVAVMERAAGPKAAILARSGDRPAGVAFVACHGPEAMLHALEVRPALRRQGVGATLMRAAANWAQTHGATRLSLVVTRQNSAACALYARLGMTVAGQYHYRTK